MKLLTLEHTSECPEHQLFSTEGNLTKEEKAIEFREGKIFKEELAIDAVNSD